MTVLLKLGGSVITEKDQAETADEKTLDRIAETIAARAPEELVLVHGGGSFGHHYAAKHGVSRTDGTHDATAIREINDAMRRLNGTVIDRLAGAGVDPLPVHPLSVGSRDAAGGLTLPVAGVGTMLAEGFVPVTHGDVISHAGRGATIISGDELIVSLAESLGAERVGLCSAVPGVLDTDGEVIDRIETFEAVAPALGASEETDVTGGMASKVKTLLDCEFPADIFGVDDLAAFLAGDHPGTLIE
ncbi:MAG: isopentenyl phosphate kinase [Halobacteriales archaeon]